MDKRTIIVKVQDKITVINDWKLFGWDVAKCVEKNDIIEIDFKRIYKFANADEVDDLHAIYEECRNACEIGITDNTTPKDKLLYDSMQIRMASILTYMSSMQV